ncbi:WXG100 family type VII secretion target [Streptomyces sp. NPDC001339]|uniref:WXG100 family type VII secretion target n=1 Tax=Streptomyces sp. NPDC001339 TaxID=3364563 RepID=UPI0036B50E70
MPGKAFDVDPDVLRTQGNAFVHIGNDFSKASKKLQDDLKSLGDPWNDCDFGTIFDTIYTPIRDGMFTSMDSLGERIEEIGDKLQHMSRKYADSDEQGIHTISAVGRPAI